jgi:hypothetical protein
MSHEYMFFTTGYTDATHVNAAAANILADAEIVSVSVVISVPEVNYLGWLIESETTFTGDDNDFLIYVTHLLLIEGYLMTSVAHSF